MKQLIINADDFGLNTGSNRAIVECFDAGSLSSASLMIGMPGTDEAIAMAAVRQDLGIAVHLNLTCGRPLSPASDVPSLVDARGVFFSRRVLERRSILRQLRADDVRREWSRQVSSALDRGVVLTHLDSHQHVHLLPQAMTAALDVAAAHALPLRMPDEPTIGDGRVRLRLRKLALRSRCRALRRAAASRGVAVTPSFLSIFGLSPMPAPGQLSLSDYARVFDRAPEGVTEFMCHPAYVNGPESCRSISDVCAAERVIMMQPAFRDTLAARGLQLATYGVLRSGRATR